MKKIGFLLLVVMVFVGVAAYMLQKRGLLSRETLDLFVTREVPEETQEAPPVEPIEMSASLQKKQRELQEEGVRLKELSTRMKLQKKELEAERQMLENQLRALRTETAQEGEMSLAGRKVTKLVKMYEGMPPEEAAAILEKLPNSTVAQILLQMRRRQAAQIMASLNPVKAAEVSELLFPEPVALEN